MNAIIKCYSSATNKGLQIRLRIKVLLMVIGAKLLKTFKKNLDSSVFLSLGDINVVLKCCGGHPSPFFLSCKINECSGNFSSK